MQIDYSKKMTEKRNVLDKLNAFHLYFENLSKNMHKLAAKNENIKTQMGKFENKEELLKTKVSLDLQLLKEVLNCLKCKFFVNEQFQKEFCAKLKQLNETLYYTYEFKKEIAMILDSQDIILTEEKYKDFFGFEGVFPDPPSESVALQTVNTAQTGSLRSMNRSYVASKKSNKTITFRLSPKQLKRVHMYILNNAVIELFFDEFKGDFFEDLKNYYNKMCVDIEIQFSSYDFNKKLLTLKQRHLEHLEAQKNTKKDPEQSLEFSMLFVEQLKSRLEAVKNQNDRYLNKSLKIIALMQTAFEKSREIVISKNLNRHLSLILSISADKNSNYHDKINCQPKKGQTSVKLKTIIMKLINDHISALIDRGRGDEAEIQKWYINKVGLQLAHIKEASVMNQFFIDNSFDIVNYLDYCQGLLVDKFSYNISIYKEKVLQIIMFVNKVSIFKNDPFAGKDSRDFVTAVKLNIKRLHLKAKLMENQNRNNKSNALKNFFMTKKKESTENVDDEEGERVNYLRNNRQDNVYIKKNLVDILETDRANKSHSLDKGRKKLKKTVKERLNKSTQFYEVINENYKVLNKLKDGEIISSKKNNGAANKKVNERLF